MSSKYITIQTFILLSIYIGIFGSFETIIGAGQKPEYKQWNS